MRTALVTGSAGFIGYFTSKRLLDAGFRVIGVDATEDAIGRKAKKNFMDIQPGDVPATWADISLLKRLTGYAPKTDVRTGAKKFVEWYREYYDVS